MLVWGWFSRFEDSRL